MTLAASVSSTICGRGESRARVERAGGLVVAGEDLVIAGEGGGLLGGSLGPGGR